MTDKKIPGHFPSVVERLAFFNPYIAAYFGRKERSTTDSALWARPLSKKAREEARKQKTLPPARTQQVVILPINLTDRNFNVEVICSTSPWADGLPFSAHTLEIASANNTLNHLFYTRHDDKLPVSIKRSWLDHVIFMRPWLTTLADYSKECPDSGTEKDLPPMTRQEKDALLFVCSYCFQNGLGPEFLTRLANPTLSMGDIPYDKGANVYFSSMVLLPSLYLQKWRYGSKSGTACTTPFTECYDIYSGKKGLAGVSTDKLREEFFENIERQNYAEGARLLGLGARHLKLDDPPSKVSDASIHSKLERYWRYIFADKFLWMHDKYLIAEVLLGDRREVAKYPEYIQRIEAGGKQILDAERELAQEITNMHDAMELNNQHENSQEYAVTRLCNNHLFNEYDSAVKFLNSNNGKGWELMFGS